MTTILDIINRKPNPEPWSEGDNIPWDDPEFSERMLVEHLSQDHDLASRKTGTIEGHVDWIFSEILGSRPVRLLDLGCGPGLYANRLAKKGCECEGIDFSPASIRHAKKTATEAELSCIYRHADVRDTDLGGGFDLVMMIYGQINVFPRNIGMEIIKKVHAALKPGGSLLLEIQARELIQRGGETPPSWYSAPSGLFSEKPHIVLQENFWHAKEEASTSRFSIIDGQTGSVNTYALSNEAYTENELAEVLHTAGFNKVIRYPSLSGKTVDKAHDLPVFLAKR